MTLSTPPSVASVRASYDAVAEPYAAQFLDELAHKPLDRALLDRLADQAPPGTVIADVGCGPGQVARYLHERGRAVVGVDLSPAMIALARAHHPGLSFQVGSLLELDVPDGAWGGVVAFYSLIHLPVAALPTAFRVFHRVLCPGGLLLLAFHAGDEVRRLDEWWGRPVSLDFHFSELAKVAAELEATEFTVEERLERAPYPSETVATRRAYLLARRKGASP